MSPIVSATTKYIIGISSLAVVASAGAYTWHRQNQHFARPKPAPPKNPANMAATTPFQTLFAVPMTCDGCVKDISGALHKLQGISKVEANLVEQLVAIEGIAPPSAIVETIQATGRDAILRGSGASNSAAVSILETFHKPTDGPAPIIPDGESDRLVRGLARIVQVSPTSTLVDLTLRGVAPGTYRATIREFGDLKDGAPSAGPVWSGRSQKAGSEFEAPRGALGTLEIGPGGHGSVFFNHPFQIWEVIGHAMVVSPHDESDGAAPQNDENTVVGVIARSAGMWDNDKTVCSCTGKTLWEERTDEVTKGML